MPDSLAISIAQQAVTAAVPLVLAGLGELVAERTGVINVGIEGLMLGGCVAGFAAVAVGAPAELGLLAAGAAGAGLAALFALATVILRADQIVAGLAINLIAVGASGTLWQELQRAGLGMLAGDQGFARGVPGLRSLPIIGPILFDQYFLCYLAIVLAGAVHWALARTRAGLIVRALGDAPDACAAAGVRVRAWRLGCVLFAGVCAGTAGAYLSIMRTHSFAPRMTGGAGFLVLALVIFGRWSVTGLAIGCLLFGAIDAAQQALQAGGYNQVVPYQALQAAPYLAALVALALVRRGGTGPSQLGKPWPGEM